MIAVRWMLRLQYAPSNCSFSSLSLTLCGRLPTNSCWLSGRRIGRRKSSPSPMPLAAGAFGPSRPGPDCATPEERLESRSGRGSRRDWRCSRCSRGLPRSFDGDASLLVAGLSEAGRCWAGGCWGEPLGFAELAWAGLPAAAPCIGADEPTVFMLARWAHETGFCFWSELEKWISYCDLSFICSIRRVLTYESEAFRQELQPLLALARVTQLKAQTRKQPKKPHSKVNSVQCIWPWHNQNDLRT